MSKKDFIALADLIRDHNRYGVILGKKPFSEDLIQALADFCQRQNPAFKRDRWLGCISGTNGKNGGAK